MLCANQIRKAYGDFETGFCGDKFGGEAKQNFPTLVSACLTHTPSLAQVDVAYGEGSAITWLYAHLAITLAYVGIKGKMSDSQIIQCARNLRNRRPDITASEMLQFFTRFEQGRYETFKGYERPNPQVITSSFEKFLEDLSYARGDAEEQRQSEQNKKNFALWEANKTPCPPEIAERIRKAGLPIKLQDNDTQEDE